jgi:hypothetical protein
MGFVINNQIWQLTEKLYIHCHKVDGFVNLLKSHEVNLPDDFYSSFEIYSFMSSEQNNFVQFMQGVPSYRYLPILEEVIFDENIRSTQRDNWNYYGVYIKNWHPELLDRIKRAGLEIDNSKNKIIRTDIEIEQAYDTQDFLKYSFNDPFLDYIRKEINESHNSGLYLAAMILSRKLAECLVVRVFEVVFKERDERGAYNEHYHSLWYDKTRSRVHNLDTLIDNLKDNSTSFYDSKDLVEEVCLLVKPFKNEINKIVHRDYKIPNKEEVDKWDIPGLFNKLRRLYIKYCNP